MGFLFLNNATSKNRHGNQLDDNQETIEMYKMGISLLCNSVILKSKERENDKKNQKHKEKERKEKKRKEKKKKEA